MSLADWNARFAGAEYVYGTEPADFVARWAEAVPAGARVLSVAEGEGRNAVHLALGGARLTAVDGSAEAVAKARRLAAERCVTVAFHEADLAAWHWRPEAFDAVLGVFIQFAPPPLRAAIFAGMARTLVPGGLLLLHGYAPRQTGYGTGGPRAAENLWTLDLLEAAFPGFDVIHAADYDAEIMEGRGHAGRSALIDFVARKPV
jgi:SAM-dependent methyltransferase